MGGIDRMIQQNAATVEESAAASRTFAATAPLPAPGSLAVDLSDNNWWEF